MTALASSVLTLDVAFGPNVKGGPVVHATAPSFLARTRWMHTLENGSLEHLSIEHLSLSRTAAMALSRLRRPLWRYSNPLGI